MIEWVLQLQYRMDTFSVVNQHSSRQPRDNILTTDIEDNRSVRRDTLKELFKLTKLFRDFITWIEDRTKSRLYRAAWEVLSAIHKLAKEYKRYSAYYNILILNNLYIEWKDRDIEINYILIFIYNALGKLHKYQELLPQSPAYAAVITINPIFY